MIFGDIIVFDYSIYLFRVGVFDIRILDILDILIVGNLFYIIYKLLRGSIAFNIFIGLVILYGVSAIVSVLNMQLLSKFLNEFVNLGLILLIIIFQPEIRRFLLYVGNTTLSGRSEFIRKLFPLKDRDEEEDLHHMQEIKRALNEMSKSKTGALIVLTKLYNLEDIKSTGVPINAKINSDLILSIFTKESPLHDGAVIIRGGVIESARCILPISKDQSLPSHVGLRHRSAVGITTNRPVGAIVVSEETGNISSAEEGKLSMNIDESLISQMILKYIR